MASGLSKEASDFVDKIIDYRGATILAFAQVEWLLAKIIVEAKSFEQYADLDLSFSQDAEKRAARVKELLAVHGPFTPYATSLGTIIDKVMQFVELRNFAAHALLIRLDPDDLSLGSKLHFRMFRMYKGNNLEELQRTLTLKEYTDEQTGLTAAAREFVVLARDIWSDLGLKHLDIE